MKSFKNRRDSIVDLWNKNKWCIQNLSSLIENLLPLTFEELLRIEQIKGNVQDIVVDGGESDLDPTVPINVYKFIPVEEKEDFIEKNPRRFYCKTRFSAYDPQKDDPKYYCVMGAISNPEWLEIQQQVSGLKLPLGLQWILRDEGLEIYEDDDFFTKKAKEATQQIIEEEGRYLLSLSMSLWARADNDGFFHPN